MTDDQVLLARLDERMTHISVQLEELAESLKTNYVTRAEFEARLKPLQLFVFGTVGAILIAVGGALLALVVK